MTFFCCLQCLLLISGSTVLAKDQTPETLIKAIEAIRVKHGVATAAVILINQNQVEINSHLGVTNWETQTPFQKGDIYRIGSISKSFAGILALKLQEKGLIKLNDSIWDYDLKPYLTNTYPDEDISLAHLLEHTAGLSDLVKAEWDYNDPSPIPLKCAFDLKLAEHQTLWPPGYYRSYSNVGPGLFGLALENKLNTSYEQLMQEYVFKPLNMANSDLLLSQNIKANLITGYDRDGKTPIPYWHNIYRPFAAINTTNQDMISWLKMLVNGQDAYLSNEQKIRLRQPTTSLAAKYGLQYGYGLGFSQWQSFGFRFFGHGGDADGYLSRFGVNPETGQAYFVMINAFNHQPLRQMVDLLERHIIKELPKPNYPLRKKIQPTTIQPYLGTYQRVTSRFRGMSRADATKLLVSFDNGQLYVQQQNTSKKAIYAVNRFQFRTASQSVATMIFTQHHGEVHFHDAQDKSWVKVDDIE